MSLLAVPATLTTIARHFGSEGFPISAANRQPVYVGISDAYVSIPFLAWTPNTDSKTRI
jgi:hypothetical protein